MGKILANIGKGTEDKQEGKRNYFDKAYIKGIEDISCYWLLLGDVRKTKILIECCFGEHHC